MSLRIRPVDSPRDLARFVDLPWRLYRDDRAWVPPLKRDVKALLDRAHNPFFEHGAAQPFVAERDGRAVGRIAAIVNAAHNDFHGDRVGFFGLFECEEDREAAGALFGAAEAWVAERGMDVLRGPMSLSTNDECGSLVEGFETPPTVLMPHNAPHHAALYEGAGFAKAMDLLAYDVAGVEAPERIVRAVDAVRARAGAVIRTIDMKRFAQEVDRIRAIYNSVWDANWGFVPMTRAEMDYTAGQLRPVVDPELVLFAEIDGRSIAFALALPDLNEALRYANGRLFPFGALAIWWHARRIRRVRVITLGIEREHRASGIDAVLYFELFARAKRRGYSGGECSWVLEDNAAMRRPIERLGGRVYKRYRVYDRAVAPDARAGAPGAAR